MSPVKLRDLLDLSALEEMARQGYVSMQLHPWEPLAILNYTHAAQYDRVWNDVTRQCRGLIARLDEQDSLANAVVVARPWPKFFNYGEHETDSLPLDEPCRVFDKLDGSLGILYPIATGYAIATRGSFTSEQAMRGTKILREKYPSFVPYGDITYLFEIIYPENRIVLDYGDTEDLVLLDERNTHFGFSESGTHWPGPRAAKMPAQTLREALALEPRENAEGIVVSYQDGLMLKIKQEDYVSLHRIVTGLNERVVWERMGNGETVREICVGLPDEFAKWVEDVAFVLNTRYESIYERACWTYNEIWNSKLSRKEFAERAKQHPEMTSYLFMILDGKPIQAAIWKNLRPSGAKQPREFSEATA